MLSGEAVRRERSLPFTCTGISISSALQVVGLEPQIIPEELKAEQKGRTSVTEGVPMAMAALSLAAKLQRRATKAGVTDADFDAGPGLGAELWGLVARARAEGIDPEEELRTVARAYRDHLLDGGH